MNSIKKQLSLINKNPFQQSLIKITWDGDFVLAKEKHYQLIINTLLGLNEKTNFQEAVKIILDSYQQVEVKKWNMSLKILMLIHYIQNNVPKTVQLKISQFIQDPSAFEKQLAQTHENSQHRNDLKNINNQEEYSIAFQKSSPSAQPTKSSSKSHQLQPPSSSSCQQIDLIHQIIVQRYYSYLIALCQRIENINYLNQKEVNTCSSFIQEWQRIKSLLVLFSIVQNFTRELEVSLINFKKVTVTQKIACLLSTNLQLVYTMLKNIVNSVQNNYLEFENTQDFVRFFTFYSEFILITRNISKFNTIKLQISQQFSSEFKTIELYIINRDLNREIELYNLKVKSLQKSTNGQADAMSLGVSTQVGDLNAFANKEFNRTKTTEIIFTKKTQADEENSVFADVFKNGNQRKSESNAEKNNLEFHLQTNKVKIQSDKNNELTIDFNLNQKKEVEGKNNKSIKQGKEVVSDFKFIKLDYEDSPQNEDDLLQKKDSNSNNTQSDTSSLRLQSSNSQKSTPAYYKENSDFKVQSKQFYDVKNNPLSFLRSQYSDQKGKLIEGLEEEDETDLIQLKKAKNEIFSQQNDELQNDQIQEIESSKNFNSDMKSNKSQGSNTYTLSNQSEKNSLNFKIDSQLNNQKIQ